MNDVGKIGYSQTGHLEGEFLAPAGLVTGVVGIWGGKLWMEDLCLSFKQADK